MRLMGWTLVLLAARFCACTDAHRPGGGGYEGEGETDAGTEQHSGEATECCWPQMWYYHGPGGSFLESAYIKTSCPAALGSQYCRPVGSEDRCWRPGEVEMEPVCQPGSCLPLPADCSRPTE